MYPEGAQKPRKAKANVLLHGKRRERSREERKRVGDQSAVADARHRPGEIEEDDVVRKAAEEGPQGHPAPPKGQDILVAKVVPQPSRDQDGDDAAAERVRRQEPRRLSVARHVERATDLRHGIRRVAQTADGEELRPADGEDEDGLLERRREPRGWSGCVRLAGATGSGDSAM